MQFKRYFNLWLPVILWCLVIFTLSSIPTLPAPEILWWDFILKKSAHVIEYAILYYLVYRAFSKNFSHKKNFSLYTIYSMLYTFLYAISDEYHQSFTPGRHCKAMDIGFDFLGMLISSWRIKTGWRIKTRKTRKKE